MLFSSSLHRVGGHIQHITCADDAAAYQDVSAVGYVDPVGVGAPSWRGDEQPRHEHFPGVGDHDVHLHAVSHLEVLHNQMLAALEVQRLRISFAN